MNLSKYSDHQIQREFARRLLREVTTAELTTELQRREDGRKKLAAKAKTRPVPTRPATTLHPAAELRRNRSAPPRQGEITMSDQPPALVAPDVEKEL